MRYMEHFNWLIILFLITSISGDDDIGCEVLKNETECTKFGHNTIAVNIANLLEMMNFTMRIETLRDRFSDVPVCKDSFAISLCLVMYPPCNIETGKLQPICLDRCSTVSNNLAKCVQMLAERMMNFVEVALLSATFNCSIPDSFFPNVSGALYDSQENCFEFAISDITESDGSSIVPIIVVPIAIVTAVIGVTLILIIMILCWKYRHRNIIVVGGSMSYNSAYGEDTLARIVTNNLELPMLQNEERQQLFTQYKIELGDILIPSNAVCLETVIGEGAFGMVCKSVYTNPKTGKSIRVAVKGLKGSTSINYVEELLEECCKMKLLDHPNVLPLIGVSVDSENFPAMVLPYMVNGDVKSYLFSQRDSEIDVDTFPENLSHEILCKMCYDIANGMEYLCKMHFVHRDLAARNCMVDDDKTIKISDFGLCRDVYVADYYRLSKSSKVPVKWMSPESLHDGMYNHQSDVWSYGVTCWEIFSLGRQPYPGVENCDITNYLKEGKRLDKPALCSDEMYQIMSSCWKDSPRQRPVFSAIVQMFETLPSKN